MLYYKKVNHAILCVLTSLSSLLLSCSLPLDEESEESSTDHTADLQWSGNKEEFVIDSQKGIQLNAQEQTEGVAYLSTPLDEICDRRWELEVALKFNPSSRNFARFYLTSSSPILNEELNGYFLEIGGVSDNVSLYRQESDDCTLLISGRMIMQGDNSPNIAIKVECDVNGVWSLWTHKAEEKDYFIEGRMKDTQITTTSCCGLLCVYTSSRSKGFRFHHICLTKGVPTFSDTSGTEPDQPDETPDLPNQVRGILLFNEVMYDAKSDGAEYVEIYNPTNATLPIDELYLGKLREDGTYMSKTWLYTGNAKRTILAHHYLCFTKSIEKLERTHNVTNESLVEISNFPPLNNSDGILVLITATGQLIDKCRFGNWMHTSNTQSGFRGLSLEKRSPELPSLNANWKSCTAPSGGTPGMENSSN